MFRLLFPFLIVATVLVARENPFFPVDSAENIPVTTNQVQNIPPLERVSVKLPSTARVVEAVTVRYKNLDGSIATKTIELEHSIDWHLPIFISQNYIVENEKKQQKTIAKTLKKENYTKVISLPFVTFYTGMKSLKIVTKDELIRDFLLVKPHRIVCDFKRDTDIRSFAKRLPKGSSFKRIRIGTHKGYYRVVIELDGYYTYSVKQLSGAYIFELH